MGLQTLTPLMLSLGREMTMTGIDALVEIGEYFLFLSLDHKFRLEHKYI